MTFFRLQTPRDMLEKANREYEKLCLELNVDNIFNFFVTAYHISDYIKKSNAVSQKVLDDFLRDPDIQASHDLCDKGKHMILTKRTDPRTTIVDGTFGSAPFGTVPFGSGECWLLLSDGKDINVELLAKIALHKWMDFFDKNLP